MTKPGHLLFSALAEATMHLERYCITKKPLVTCSIWLRKLVQLIMSVGEVTESLVRDLWLGH